MSTDRLLELLRPYRTFNAVTPEELRAAIARQRTESLTFRRDVAA